MFDPFSDDRNEYRSLKTSTREQSLKEDFEPTFDDLMDITGVRKDRELLSQFYKETCVFQPWFQSDGWLEAFSDHCEWFGITCDENHRVTNIDLPFNGLTGKLPPVIGQFEVLQGLDLTSNDLEGELNQAHFQNLKNLSYFVVKDNHISKIEETTFENAIFKDVYLEFSHNPILSVPSLMGDQLSSRLAWLGLGLTYLQEIPESFERFLTLVGLDLGQNQGVKGIERVWKIPSLWYLNLGCVGLTSLPDDLSHMSTLDFLDLSGNEFSEFPKGVLTLLNVQVLALERNYIQHIPSSLSQLTNLLQFTAWDNQFATFPQLEMPHLNALSIFRNSYLHEVNVSGLPGLKYLQVECDHLYPDSLENFEVLQQVLIARTVKIPNLPKTVKILQITNVSAISVPPLPVNLTLFTILSQKSPLTVEDFPNTFPNLFKLYIEGPVLFNLFQSLPSLQTLYLQNTLIQGTLPQDRHSWPLVAEIHLINNTFLTGEVPFWLTQSSVRFLTLQNNSFSGNLNLTNNENLVECNLEQSFPKDEFRCSSDSLMGVAHICNVQCDSTQNFVLEGVWINEKTDLVDQCFPSYFGPVWSRAKLEIFENGTVVGLSEFEETCSGERAFSFLLEGEIEFLSTKVNSKENQLLLMEVNFTVRSQKIFFWNPSSPLIFGNACFRYSGDKTIRKWIDLSDEYCLFHYQNHKFDFELLTHCPVRQDKWFFNFKNSTLITSGGTFSGHISNNTPCHENSKIPELRPEIKFRRNWVCRDALDISSCSPECEDGFTFGSEVCDTGVGCGPQCDQFLDGWTCEINENSVSVCEAVCGDNVVVSKNDCDALNESDGGVSTKILVPSIVVPLVFFVLVLVSVYFVILRNSRLKNIPGKELILTELIGEGNFGKVYKGTWRSSTVVAVKLLKQNEELTKKQIQEFSSEAKIFMKVPPHPNIVQFLGLCFEDCNCNLNQMDNNNEQEKFNSVSQIHSLKIVTEFLVAGDLSTFLRTEFVFVTSEKLTMAKGLEYSVLVGLAKGISAGMDHLHKNGIVHRDLAARNVLIQLIAENEEDVENESRNSLQKRATYSLSLSHGKWRVIPKISDFGLAATGEQKRAVPVRWSAPEVLRDSKNATKKSDVWSFGVVLFELSVGCHVPPYFECKTLSSVVEFVMSGSKLSFPCDCPVGYVSLAEVCLNSSEIWRPEFHEISEQLSQIQKGIHRKKQEQKEKHDSLEQILTNNSQFVDTTDGTTYLAISVEEKEKDMQMVSQYTSVDSNYKV